MLNVLQIVAIFIVFGKNTASSGFNFLDDIADGLDNLAIDVDNKKGVRVVDNAEDVVLLDNKKDVVDKKEDAVDKKEDDTMEDMADETAEFLSKDIPDFAKNVKEAFNQGYDNFITEQLNNKVLIPLNGNNEDYKAYKKSRYFMFVKNYKGLKETEDKTRRFSVDETVKFMFMSESEKKSYLGLGNLTELEKQLDEKEAKDAKKVKEAKKAKKMKCGLDKNGNIECVNPTNKEDQKEKGISQQDADDETFLKLERKEEASSPESLDLRDLGIITAVKNQGFICLSCWAFCAIGALEGAFAMATG